MLVLTQQILFIAAVSKVAEQTFIFRQGRMRLADHLTVIFVASVAGFCLRIGQKLQIRAHMEAAVTFFAALIGVRLVRMGVSAGLDQFGVANSAGVKRNFSRFRCRIMGIVAIAAF